MNDHKIEVQSGLSWTGTGHTAIYIFTDQVPSIFGEEIEVANSTGPAVDGKHFVNPLKGLTFLKRTLASNGEPSLPSHCFDHKLEVHELKKSGKFGYYTLITLTHWNWKQVGLTLG